MSGFCEVALAVGLTFGGLCVHDQPVVKPRMPIDDPAAWKIEVPPPPPPPEVKPPVMPPVIIEKRVEVKHEAPPPVMPSIRIEKPAKPDPYRVMMEHALAGRGRQSAPMVEVAFTTVNEPVKLASLDPASNLLQPPKPARDEEYKAGKRLSGLPVDNSRIFAADRYISGILETGINSQLGSKDGGQVVIQTSRDLFGYHNRNILIPKGSRLICDYESPKDMGSTRLALNCVRILMAGHRAEILQLKAPVGDAQGRAGVTGEIDRRFWEQYGSAFMLTGISAAVRLASASAAAIDDTSSIGAISDKGSQELSEKLGEITASILEQTADLKPIITVPQGTRVQIRPANDWYIQQTGE